VECGRHHNCEWTRQFLSFWKILFVVSLKERVTAKTEEDEDEKVSPPMTSGQCGVDEEMQGDCE
jgi:hypothetical protein